MNPRATKRLAIPTTLAVTVVALGAALACAPTPSSDASSCDPVRVPDTAVVTYMCQDGRACGPTDPTAIDGGVYQICPDDSDCATLVTYDGQASVGLC